MSATITITVNGRELSTHEANMLRRLVREELKHSERRAENARGLALAIGEEQEIEAEPARLEAVK